MHIPRHKRQEPGNLLGGGVVRELAAYQLQQEPMQLPGRLCGVGPVERRGAIQPALTHAASCQRGQRHWRRGGQAETSGLGCRVQRPTEARDLGGRGQGREWPTETSGLGGPVRGLRLDRPTEASGLGERVGASFLLCHRKGQREGGAPGGPRAVRAEDWRWAAGGQRKVSQRI